MQLQRTPPSLRTRRMSAYSHRNEIIMTTKQVEYDDITNASRQQNKWITKTSQED
jgi:hypothetical protein